MNQLMKKKVSQVSNKKKKGFTLVELIIVIAIIAILAAMAIPRLGAMRQNARISNDVAAAKNISTIASTLIANGNIIPAAAETAIAVNGADANAVAIRAQLDGRANTGNTEASAETFTLLVAPNGGVRVTVNNTNAEELYPDNTGTGRPTYSNRVRNR